MAIGGSTNALIHLIAMAGARASSFTLDDFDAISRRVPGAGQPAARRRRT
jgi:dihydroxyacid dehydratase/phosphogluconate dehydratase